MVRVLSVCLFSAAALWGQQYVIFTIAGGTLPLTPGPASSLSIGDPPRVAVDSAGNLYFGSDHAIFKVDASGVLTCIAGTGREGFTGDGGPALSAQISYPWGIAVDAAGNVYFTDRNSNYIRRVSTGGTIGIFAGSATAGYVGDGGPAVDALFNGPSGLAFDPAGNLYVADTGNQRIRKIATNGTVSSVAGSGEQGYTNDTGPAIYADLNGPEGVAADSAGNLYIADTLNQRVRIVSPNGVINTLAGTGFPGYSGDGGPANQAEMFLPTDVAADRSGNVYVADLGSSRIREVSNGIINTIAGSDSGTTPTPGQAAISIRFNGPTGVAVDTAGNVYFAEGTIGSGSELTTGDFRVWQVSQQIANAAAGNGLESYAGDGGLASFALMNMPTAEAIDSAGNLYFADTGNHRVRQISRAGNIVTVAGTGSPGFSGDGGPATSAQLDEPMGVAVDGTGNLYIADSANNRIRVVNPAGMIYTMAGNGNAAFEGDEGPAVQASLHAPEGLAVDSTGTVYVADTLSLRVRYITTDGVIHTLAGSGVAGYSGDGGQGAAANVDQPTSVAVDQAGNVYFTDAGNGLVRKVTPAGVISTVAGTPLPTTPGVHIIPLGDGGPATQAGLIAPKTVLVDAAGNLYITDSGENRLRKVTTDGNIATIAGNGNCCYSGDGGLGTSAQLNAPWGLTMDSAGNLYVTDSGNNAIRQVAPAGSSAFITQVSNAASGQTGSIAPGEIVAIFGAGLGPAAAVQYQATATGTVATQLGGTQALFNGIPAPLLYSSAGQVSAVVPYELTGSKAQVTVSYQGHTTAAVNVTVAASAPAIFSLNASGTGQARAFNSDGSANSAANPAAPGSTISFYATGEGETAPVAEDGQIDGANPPTPVLPVAVTIGGQAAAVQSAGGVSGQVAGLMIVQVQVPLSLAANSATPIQLQVGSVSSPPGVTVAVR